MPLNHSQRQSRFLLLTIGLVVAVACACGEILIRTAYLSKHERELGAERTFLSLANLYARNQLGEWGIGNCTYTDTLIAHPFLGWVSRKIPPCNSPGDSALPGIFNENDLPA